MDTEQTVIDMVNAAKAESPSDFEPEEEPNEDTEAAA